MNNKKPNVRALGLCSGGLDSTLAGVVLRNQGIEVEWVSFETPFFSATKARRASEATGIPLTVKPIYPVYIDMLKNPPAGYGKFMNPCMDCHALMFKLAGEIMRRRNFDFLFSGEVLGQRPMSQNKTSLRYVEKHSGFDGYILRPLTAKNLPETIPEKKGLVDREQLLDISGRGRKSQIKLAAEFGVRDYPAPAGGCLLTDKGYTNRLRDLFEHQDSCTEAELHLLKFGRHYRLNPQTKLVVGRTEKDNENILKYHDPRVDTVIDVKDYPSPIALVPYGGAQDSIMLAASICTGHSKAPQMAMVKVLVKTGRKKKTIKVIALQPDDVRKLMIK
ncbi:Possible RNA methyltransferase aq_898 [Olavius algarvensis Delta 1 endosymbiont]|nr:Possible RNA methyltransferase aq_898 [Olavius algarvensis Delta 1 endosymbiont]